MGEIVICYMVSTLLITFFKKIFLFKVFYENN